MSEICSELTIKTPERRQWRHSGVFIAKFEWISQIVLVFPIVKSIMKTQGQCVKSVQN